MQLYRLESRPLTKWGDYGDMLTHGMTMHLGRATGFLQLERTAPFVPPISVSSDVVVTEAAKGQLETSGLTGLSFLPVVKARIVRLAWERWDRAADEPPLYPAGGEPEGYILERPHDPRAAKDMGNLYQLVVQPSARVERIDDARSPANPRVRLIRESWDGSDFFGAEGVSIVYVSAKAKFWLEETFGDYVTFWPG